MNGLTGMWENAPRSTLFSRMHLGLTRVLAILKDFERRPELFHWFGAIDRSTVESWALGLNLVVPRHLLDLWSQTGGGDCFESETLFRPTTLPSAMPYFVAGDDIVSANEHRAKQGKPASYLVFHDGVFSSAIRLADNALVTLGHDYQETGMYSDLNEWYVRALRAEFTSKYGLLDFA
jgi:hypothetical protein